MSKSIVSMKNVYYAYEKKSVLTDIDFDISHGAFMGLVGPNGGGKTTLIKLLLGVIKPDSGTISLFNEPIGKFKAWNRIGFVSQKSNSFNKGFPATVFEVVSMGLTAKIGYFKFLKKQDKAKILQAIEQVGMSEYAYQNIGNLSGGQQQRVFIARSLVNDPELLILDEPTVGVDHENVQRFYKLLHQLNQARNITLLLVTHDTGMMTEHASDIVCLNRSLYFHGGPKEYISLTDWDLSHFYGHPLTHDH